MVAQKKPIIRMRADSSFYYEDKYIKFDDIVNISPVNISILRILGYLFLVIELVVITSLITSDISVVGIVGIALLLLAIVHAKSSKTQLILTLVKRERLILSFGGSAENKVVMQEFYDYIVAKLDGKNPDIPEILRTTEPSNSQSIVQGNGSFTDSFAPLNVNLPEERVRQYVLGVLKSEFGFVAKDIAWEVPIQMGSSTKRLDIVVYKSDKPHTQENIDIIIECKRADRNDTGSALRQLKSYMSACLNARYGVVAADKWTVYQKIADASGLSIERIPALPDHAGIARRIEYQPQVQANV